MTQTNDNGKTKYETLNKGQQTKKNRLKMYATIRIENPLDTQKAAVKILLTLRTTVTVPFR